MKNNKSNNKTNLDLLPARISKLLEVLIIEDNEDTYFSIVRELSRAGFPIKAKRADEYEALYDDLLYHPWDLIISNSKPADERDICSSLFLLRKAQSHLPVIILSGLMKTERAVEYINLGANDHSFKKQLTKLIPILKNIAGRHQ